MLTLATFIKTLKRYALDSSMTDEAFLNAALEPYVQAGRIKGRGGAEFHLDAPRTSRLLSGKADVPKALKKPLRRFGIDAAVTKNADIFLDDCLDLEDEEQLEEDLLSEIGTKDTASATLCEKLEKLKGNAEEFFACALLASLRNSNLITQERVLWQNGTGSFAVETGDLFSKGFGRKKVRKNIVVIPVNTGFDTVVSWGLEGLTYPRVSATSVHGTWLQRMYRCGETATTLAERIEQNLRVRHIKPINAEAPKRYPIGTTAIIENEKALFFLLAASEFDERNIAHSSPKLIEKALIALVNEYDAIGQGLDLYLPLMGTGLSRAGLSVKESYDLISETLAEHRQCIHGRITLIVCPNDEAKLME